jgi:hypothetical protein
MRFAKLGMAALAAAALGGCASMVTLTARDGGPGGVGVSPGAVGGRGALKITLEGKQYIGEWVVSSEGGFAGFSNADKPAAKALGSKRLGKATGIVRAGIASNGDGRAYANGPDGSTLHCNFRFDAVTSVAQGLCERNDGRLYDLTMRQ